MAPNSAHPEAVKEANSSDSGKSFTYKKLRAEKDALFAIHGKVYNVKAFLASGRHPGGAVLRTGLGRDATTLFETHHNLVDDQGMEKIAALMKNFEVGTLRDYKPVARFDSPFAKEMLQRVKSHLKKTGTSHRDSFRTYASLLFFFTSFFTLAYLQLRYQSYLISMVLGVIMAIGHLAGHAGNHGSVSSIGMMPGIPLLCCITKRTAPIVMTCPRSTCT
jgi:cytochrome b involved in lipid metabolism